MSGFVQKASKYSSLFGFGLGLVVVSLMTIVAMNPGRGMMVIFMVLGPLAAAAFGYGLLASVFWAVAKRSLGTQDQSQTGGDSQDTRTPSLTPPAVKNRSDWSLGLLLLSGPVIFTNILLMEPRLGWLIVSLVLSGLSLGILWSLNQGREIPGLTNRTRGKLLIGCVGVMLATNPPLLEDPIFTVGFLLASLIGVSLMTDFLRRAIFQDKKTGTPRFCETLTLPHKICVLGICPMIVLTSVLQTFSAELPTLGLVPFAVFYVPLAILGYVMDWDRTFAL